MKKKYEIFSGLTSGLLHSMFFLYVIPLFYILGEEDHSFSKINSVIGISILIGGLSGILLYKKLKITTESIYIYSMITMFLSTAFFSWIPERLLIYLLGIVFFADSLRFIRTPVDQMGIIKYALYYMFGWLFISLLFSFVPLFKDIRWFFLLMRFFSFYLIVMIFQFMGEYRRRKSSKVNYEIKYKSRLDVFNLILRFAVITLLSIGRGFFISDSLSGFYERIFLISLITFIVFVIIEKSNCKLCFGNKRMVTYIDSFVLIIILTSIIKENLIDPVPISFLYLIACLDSGTKRINRIFIRILYFSMIFFSVIFYQKITESFLNNKELIVSSTILSLIILVLDLFKKD